MLEEKVREAIVRELQRQAEERPQSLRVEAGAGTMRVDGQVDLEALAMAVVSSVAGGP